MSDLTQKACKPCEGKTNPLTREEAQHYLKQVKGWSLADDGKSITLKCVMKNFMAGVHFIQQVAAVAEDNDHHPDLTLEGYRHLTIVLSTHAIGGLSENDFILAAKINALSGEFKEDPYRE